MYRINKIILSVLMAFILLASSFNFTSIYASESENENETTETASADSVSATPLTVLTGPVVTVTNVTDLYDTVMNATQDKVINLGSGFPMSTLTSMAPLNPTHTYTITIDGGNQEVLNINGSIFSFTSGSFVLQNFIIRGNNVIYTRISASNTEITFKNIELANLRQEPIIMIEGTGKVVFDNIYAHDNVTPHSVIASIAKKDSVEVKNSTFVNNINPSINNNPGDYSGGAIRVVVAEHAFNVSNSVFINNETTGATTKGGNRGGAIAVSEPKSTGTLTIVDSYFEGNSATNRIMGNGGITSTADGGAISIFQALTGYKVFIDNSTFTKNFASDDGGAILLEAAASNRLEATITNSTFYKNLAKSEGNVQLNSGGAIHGYRPVTLTVTNSTFVGNEVYDYNTSPLQKGAAIAGSSVTLTSKNSLYVGNYAVDKSGNNRDALIKTNINTATNSIDAGNNIGYDMTTASTITMEDVFGSIKDGSGKVMVDLSTNFSNVTAGSNNQTMVVPTLPILPNQGVAPSGAANVLNGDNSSSTITTFDQRGMNYINDIGAVEIAWVRYDANGGTFSGLPSLTSYDGTKYYTGSTPTTYDSISYVGATENLKTDSFLGLTHANPMLEFIGWSSSPTGAVDPSYAPNTVYNTINGDVTLYAVWAPKALVTHKVEFESNGGSAVASYTAVTDNSLITAPAQPSKSGYTFAGWYTDDNTFTNTWDFATNTVTSSITLYAKWEANAVNPQLPTPQLPSTGISSNHTNIIFGATTILIGGALVILDAIRKRKLED